MSLHFNLCTTALIKNISSVCVFTSQSNNGPHHHFTFTNGDHVCPRAITRGIFILTEGHKGAWKFVLCTLEQRFKDSLTCFSHIPQTMCPTSVLMENVLRLQLHYVSTYTPFLPRQPFSIVSILQLFQLGWYKGRGFQWYLKTFLSYTIWYWNAGATTTLN